MATVCGSFGTVRGISGGLVALMALGVVACSDSPGDDTMQPTGGSAGAANGGSPGAGGVTNAGAPSIAGSNAGGTVGAGGGAGRGGTAGSSPALPGGASGTGGAATFGGKGFGGRTTGGAAGAGTGTAGTGTAGTGTAGAGAGSMPSKGCNGAVAPKSGRFTIDVDGTMREYILAVPNDYDSSEPYRVVFGWHPLGGSAQQVASGGYYGLEREAAGKAIFVSPEGLPFQGGSLGWANANGRDLAFLAKMLDRFRGELCIDENRIFSTGFSFGGMMSFAVGCAGVMRAIAPQAGNIQVSGCEDGTKPVAVMGFHGDDDTVVAIDGGRRGRDVFIERNQCMSQTAPVEPSWCDGLNANNQPCSCVSYQGCSAGYPVIWCEFNGPHTPAPSSGATIWKFFSQF